MEDVDATIGKPINAFLLLKRFMWEWVDLENWIKISMPARGQRSKHIPGMLRTLFKKMNVGPDKLLKAVAHICKGSDLNNFIHQMNTFKDLQTSLAILRHRE